MVDPRKKKLFLSMCYMGPSATEPTHVAKQPPKHISQNEYTNAIAAKHTY